MAAIQTRENNMTQPLDPAIWKAVCQTVDARHSVRSYLPTQVPREVIEEILCVASRSPSGTNTQPWHVYVVSGAARARVVNAVCAAYDADPDRVEESYRDVYCNLNGEPYLTRKKRLGKAMYGLMGIGIGEREKMHAQRRRNFELFGAPVGIFVTVDKAVGHGSWMDAGMFMQTVMVVAKAYGLDTCPQAFWVQYESVVKSAIGWPDDQRLVSGICLGYVDDSAPENKLRSERAPVEEFAVFQE